MKNLKIRQGKHGMNGTRPYNIWCGMKRRCYNKNEINYNRYGGNGVKMCDDWKGSFLGFWNDMKDTYFDEATIDRIDNKKDYSKESRTLYARIKVYKWDLEKAFTFKRQSN